MLFADRRRRRDPHLAWKVRLFSVAAAFGLAGIYFDERWMTGVAIALLGAAVLLRFARGVGPNADGPDDAGEEGTVGGEGGVGPGS